MHREVTHPFIHLGGERHRESKVRVKWLCPKTKCPRPGLEPRPLVPESRELKAGFHLIASIVCYKQSARSRPKLENNHFGAKFNKMAAFHERANLVDSSPSAEPNILIVIVLRQLVVYTLIFMDFFHEQPPIKPYCFGGHVGCGAALNSG